MNNSKTPEISVVVPVTERHDNLTKLYTIYADELKKINKNFEFLFVLDEQFDSAYEDLKRLNTGRDHLRIIKFSGNFGESAALMEGFNQAKGNKILTLASYIQIEPSDMANVFSAYE